jgi:hypothetical protein
MKRNRKMAWVVNTTIVRYVRNNGGSHLHKSRAAARDLMTT